MNVLTIESKVWWIARPEEIRSQRGVPIVDAIRKITETFQFLKYPTGFPEASGGYHFQEGKIVIEDRVVTIKAMTIYNDGFSVEVYSGTDDGMIVLEKMLDVGESLGMRRPIAAPTLYFNSYIVLDLDNSINKMLVNYDRISRLLGDAMGIEGKHDLRTIEFSVDPKGLVKEWGQLNPTVFQLERRTGVDYSQDRFFSAAHTETKNHLRILEGIERLLASGA